MDLEFVNDPEDGLVAIDRETGEQQPLPMKEIDVQKTHSESINTEETRLTGPRGNRARLGVLGDVHWNDSEGRPQTTSSRSAPSRAIWTSSSTT